jgi:murein DD-endopeptidase MepM/ murein hydrolase activator NlpD
MKEFKIFFLTILVVFAFLQSLSVRCYQLSSMQKDDRYNKLLFAKNVQIAAVEKKVDYLNNQAGLGNAGISNFIANAKENNFDKLNLNDIPNDMKKYYLDGFIGSHGLDKYRMLNDNFIFPVQVKDGFVTSEFGWRVLNGKPDLHCGQDFCNWSNGEVYASAAGRVIAQGWDNGDGNYILIEHKIQGKFYHTYYCHLFSIATALYQRVNQGQYIGVMGDTGYRSEGVHCHLTLLFWDGYKWIILNPVTSSTFGNKYIRGYYYGNSGIVFL